MSRGRPKGYSPYIDITYEELGDYLGRKSFVKVGKAWLEEILARSESTDARYTEKVTEKVIEQVDKIVEDTDRIEYNITQL